MLGLKHTNSLRSVPGYPLCSACISLSRHIVLIDSSVLMQWAEGGSLDDFIDVRLGRKLAHTHMHPSMPTTSLAGAFDDSIPPSPASAQVELPVGESSRTTPTQTYAMPSSVARDQQIRFTEPGTEQLNRSRSSLKQTESEDQHSRSARIRAFRAYQRAPTEEKERMRRDLEGMADGPVTSVRGVAAGPSTSASERRTEWTPVHLLSAEEVKSLFHDVVEGLGFLVRTFVMVSQLLEY